MRRLALAVSLSLVSAGTASADAKVWIDPARGCGRGATFLDSGRVADLPGCSGKLPKDAPAVEVALHDAKRALLDVDKDVERGRVEKLDAALAEVQTALARTQPMNPDMPDRWDEARPFYERAIRSLRDRGRLIAHMPSLRAAYSAAVQAGHADAAHPVTSDEKLRLAGACLREFAAVQSAGIDPATVAEVDKGRPRPLADARAECDDVRKGAEAARATEKAAQAKRSAWRKHLKGDRLQVFDAHAAALPDAGPAATPAKGARAPVWRYTTDRGVETFRFKGNRLVSSK
jgi:hypothetical protein